MSREQVQVELVRTIRFDRLDDETQDDVVASIRHITQEDEDDVRIGLENGPAILPLVDLKTRDVYDPERSISVEIAKRYAEELSHGAMFPPVIIDSSRKSGGTGLLEGGHRVAAVVIAKIGRITAIDIAGARVVKTPEGLETYDFKWTRSQRSLSRKR